MCRIEREADALDVVEEAVEHVVRTKVQGARGEVEELVGERGGHEANYWLVDQVPLPHELFSEVTSPE